jgi:hypothetical protein
MAQRVPRSASLAFDIGLRAVGEQLARIDSLDSKAGILLAADGVIAGLIFVRGGLVATMPMAVALVISVSILLSLVCTLVSFADREYLAPPRPETVARLSAAPEDWIKWRLMGNVLRAVETNRGRLRSKARWLTLGQATLLVTLMSLGSYFIYELVRDVP